MPTLFDRKKTRERKKQPPAAGVPGTDASAQPPAPTAGVSLDPRLKAKIDRLADGFHGEYPGPKRVPCGVDPLGAGLAVGGTDSPLPEISGTPSAPVAVTLSRKSLAWLADQWAFYCVALEAPDRDPRFERYLPSAEAVIRRRLADDKLSGQIEISASPEGLWVLLLFVESACRCEERDEAKLAIVPALLDWGRKGACDG